MNSIFLDSNNHTKNIKMKANILLVIISYLFVIACSESKEEKFKQALQEQNIEKIKSILAKIQNINAPFKNGETGVQIAVKQNNLEILELLINKGAKIDPKTPLLFEAKTGEIANFLLTNGASIETQDKEGNTLLHLSKDTSIAAIFLKYGGNIDQQNVKGETPLIKAAQKGNTNIFRWLIKKGSNVETKDAKGKSALEHISPGTELDKYWKQKLAVLEEEQKRKEEERKKQIALQNTFPAKGKIGYICNYGASCQVFIREVAGEKVKVEILEKCWPKRMNTNNLSKALDAGNVKWYKKRFLYQKRQNCR